MLSLFAQMKAGAIASLLWAEATPGRRYAMVALALLASLAPALLMTDERAIFLTHDRAFAGYAGFGPVQWHSVQYGVPGAGGPGAPGMVGPAGPAGAPPARPGGPGLPALPPPFIGYAGVPDGFAPPADGALVPPGNPAIAPFALPGGGGPAGVPTAGPPGVFGVPPGGALISAVPEPRSWLAMVAGIALVGLTLRRRAARERIARWLGLDGPRRLTFRGNARD